MNILLTGGSGLIGSELTEKLIENGHQVRILTREKDIEHPFYHWSKDRIDDKVFENLDGIIHLAGALRSLRRRGRSAGSGTSSGAHCSFSVRRSQSPAHGME